MNEINFMVKNLGKAVVLRGIWKWKQYSTITENFGWCVYAADDEARESMANLFKIIAENNCVNVFIRAQKNSGKEEIIRLPQPCFAENRCLRWFEFGKTSLREFKAEYTKLAKENGIKTKFEIVEL